MNGSIGSGDSPFTEPVAAEVSAYNAGVVTRLAALPDRWQFSMEEQRRQRDASGGTFGHADRSPRAQTMFIPGPGGDIRLRILAPSGGGCRGVYLYLHSGGWSLGSDDAQDFILERVSNRCGLAAVAVNYRLAPENPYPAGPDDCEAAALWVIRDGLTRLGGDRFVIGGASAGAHLSAVTLLRLRDRHGITPAAAANLQAGCYDLRLTPSVRNWGSEPLVLNTRDVAEFVRAFIGDHPDPVDPDISPLFADLRGLPPALFTVGTRDPLVDDTTFMHARWLAAGNCSEIAIWPGAPHGLNLTGLPQADAAMARMEDFLASA